MTSEKILIILKYTLKYIIIWAKMRYFFRFIPIAASIILIFIVAICLNDWFTRWNGAIGIISFSVILVTWVANFYYFRNERFYLLVQRALLYLRRADTNWLFNVQYYNVAKNNDKLPWQKEGYAEQIALLLKEVLNKPVLIKSHLLNKAVFCIDRLINFTLRYNSEPSVFLSVDKLLVPAQRYKEYINILSNIFTTLERDLQAKEAIYTMHIEFPNRNPYFGFFIRHIPKSKLNEFRCTFNPSITSQRSRIEVQKNSIAITTDSINNLNILAMDYLSLSKTLIIGGNK